MLGSDLPQVPTRRGGRGGGGIEGGDRLCGSVRRGYGLRGGVRSAKSFGSSVFTVFVCVCGLCVSLSLTLCMFRVLVGVCGCVGA